MLVKHSVLLGTLGCLISAATAAECLPPATPILPDGSVASEAVMIQAQTSVSDFLSEARAYLQCLEQEEALSRAGGTETEESKSQRDEDYKAMLETTQEVNEQFLEQLEEFESVDR